jgi:hypothetical protein
MNIRKVGAMSFFAVCVVGCASPVPVAENFPVSYQKVARTAHHWDVIANDVVSQTASTLTSTKGLQGRPIFVVPTTRNSAFDAVFNDFLINQMVDRGLQVNVCAPTESRMSQEPEVKVKYQTRVIIHSEAPQYRPGLLTALAAGVFVGRSIADSDISRDARGLAGVAVGGLLDTATGHLALATRTEVIVTTTIEEKNHFIMRRSDIYYVPDGDANLFIRRVSQSPLCPASSQGESAAVSAEEKAEADAALRYELLAEEMRRTNPNWQPHGNPFQK